MKKTISNKITYTVDKKQFRLDWFSGTGAGGQHRNNKKCCARLVHIPTGIIKIGQSHRDRQANKREALQSMADDPKFKVFCEMKLKEIERGVTLEEIVDDMMSEENLKVEVRENGKWKEV